MEIYTHCGIRMYSIYHDVEIGFRFFLTGKVVDIEHCDDWNVIGTFVVPGMGLLVTSDRL